MFYLDFEGENVGVAMYIYNLEFQAFRNPNWHFYTYVIKYES